MKRAGAWFGKASSRVASAAPRMLRWPSFTAPGRAGVMRGAILAFLGAAVVAVNRLLPVLWIPGEPGRSASRDDLAQAGAVAYERHLLDWPVAAGAALAVLGLATLVLALRPDWAGGRRDAVQRLLAAGCVAAGFVLALTAARWLGFYGARLLDDAAPLAHLHVVPYANLAIGAAALALCLRTLWPWLGSQAGVPGAVRAGALALAAFGATLLLAPLLPAAVTTIQGSRFHYDEVTLHTVFGDDSGIRAVAAWGWTRVSLGAGMAAAAACLAWGFARLPHAKWATLLPLVPLACATAFAVRFYLGVGSLPQDATAWPNPLPLALAALWVVQGRQVHGALRATADAE